eukprot:6463470-Amphidinium_carterae.1
MYRPHRDSHVISSLARTDSILEESVRGHRSVSVQTKKQDREYWQQHMLHVRTPTKTEQTRIASQRDLDINGATNGYLKFQTWTQNRPRHKARSCQIMKLVVHGKAH